MIYLVELIWRKLDQEDCRNKRGSDVLFSRWWSDGQDASTTVSEGTNGVLYTATPGTSYAGPMKLINNIFSSDLSFNLRREDAGQNGRNGEVGVSGRDYALVSADMWLQALKR